MVQPLNLDGERRHTDFELNGRTIALTGVDPRQSLLRWLKQQRMTGTKEGCADGDCGACTVALVELDHNGVAHYRAVNSCLLPMGFLPGRSVLTVEALAKGDSLHAVQRAMVECAGSQCGYCTPGFVMSLFTGLNEDELNDHTISGNLCRCTGYRPIREALAQLQTAPRDVRPHALALESAQLCAFFSPTTVKEALDIKAAHNDAAWIGGATDLGVSLSRQLPVAQTLIALDRIPEIAQLEVTPARVRIGAGVTLTRIERELQGVFASLDQMIEWFAARQVRNRATLGGNLASASPIGDLLPLLLALDAEIELRSAQGTRRVSIKDFFIGYRKTLLEPDELIIAIDIPCRAGRHIRSLKVAKRQTDDISIVAASFSIEINDLKKVTHVRLAYGGVAATPVRALSVENYLAGRTLDAETIAAAGAMLRTAFSPLSDHRAGADYRRALCGTLFEQFCAELPA